MLLRNYVKILLDIKPYSSSIDKKKCKGLYVAYFAVESLTGNTLYLCETLISYGTLDEGVFPTEVLHKDENGLCLYETIRVAGGLIVEDVDDFWWRRMVYLKYPAEYSYWNEKRLVERNNNSFQGVWFMTSCFEQPVLKKPALDWSKEEKELGKKVEFWIKEIKKEGSSKSLNFLSSKQTNVEVLVENWLSWHDYNPFDE